MLNEQYQMNRKQWLIYFFFLNLNERLFILFRGKERRINITIPTVDLGIFTKNNTKFHKKIILANIALTQLN